MRSIGSWVGGILAACSLGLSFSALADELTERQRELLREFEAISQKDAARHNPRSKTWFDKVKAFFES